MLHYPEIAGLIEWRNDLLKVQLQCCLGQNTLWSWGNVLHVVIYALRSNQCMVIFFQVLEQSGRSRSDFSDYYP